MPIKVKEKTGNKIIARCSNPMELQWLMQVLAGMKSPDGKRTPITSVQNLQGEEIKPPMQRPSPEAQGIVASGQVVTEIPKQMPIPCIGESGESAIRGYATSGNPNTIELATKPVEIIHNPIPIKGEQVSVCGDCRTLEDKDERQVPVVDEGKTG